jgi:GWxTD domain-containing protein
MYRIPYNHFVFEKDGNNYKASLRIMVEVMIGDDLIVRDFQDEKVTVNSFDITQNKNVSVQGFISFNLQTDDYNIKGVLNDLSSDKEMKFSPEHIRLSNNNKKGIYNPIVVNLDEKDCNGNELPLIINHSGSIPFSSQDYQLVIPVADTSVQSLTVELKNKDGDSVANFLTESYTSNLEISECNNKLFLGKNNLRHPTKNFILRNFSNKLDEGTFILSIKRNDDNDSINFPLNVEWIGKPRSLRDPEFAIEMLQYIEGSDSVIDKMLDVDSDEYQDELIQYWKKYDPTPNTKYNELMAEYYSRIDYAASEFKSLTKRNGISSDRGKVYIKYGKPDKIERSSDEYGYVVETWIYGNAKQRFVFVDKDGTGNFVLVEG